MTRAAYITADALRPAYVVTADAGLDSVCYTLPDARRSARAVAACGMEPRIIATTADAAEPFAVAFETWATGQNRAPGIATLQAIARAAGICAQIHQPERSPRP